MSLPSISEKTLALCSGRKTRKQHLAMIKALAKTQGETAAMCYWLSECARISRASVNEAMR